MMKGLINLLVATAALVMGAACQRDAMPQGAKTAFKVEIPAEALTKTVSEANKVDVVYYEVWDEDFEARLFPMSDGDVNYADVDGRIAEIDIALVKDQRYNLIFWAQNKACGAYSWSDLKNVDVDYSMFVENGKDVYDAFYAVKDVLADGLDKTVYLRRPFAQLNFGSSVMTTTVGDITITSNSVKISDVATSFNTVEGKANKTSYVKDVTFTAAAGGLVQQEKEDKKDLMVGTTGYYWVAMNYLLVPSDTQATVTVDATFVTDGGTVTHNLEYVPLKKNYRTNIIGDLFTSSTRLNIVVDPEFEKEDLWKEINN
jgi:hypothetical protein